MVAGEKKSALVFPLIKVVVIGGHGENETTRK
jgi:hypothetical protein